MEEIYRYKLLLVDDEVALLNLIKEVLFKEGFQNIDTASTGVDGILKAKDFQPDLTILDINLPDIDGYQVCEKIRVFSNNPILFLSANKEDQDRIKGFMVGGDDYITKPFNIVELVMRVKAQLRRYQPKTNQNPIIEIANLQLDVNAKKVTKENQEIILTAKEYQLLFFLMSNPNHLFSKFQLCEHIWGYENEGNDNTIMVHIRHLREKIEDDPSNPKLLMTVKGLGYRMVKKI